MDEQIVRFEELLAGALLKFKRVDKVDMALLIEGLSTYAAVCYEDTTLSFIKDYVEVSKNGWKLGSNLKLSDYAKLEKEQGNIVALYLNNLDLTEFVLKKIKYLGEININNINDVDDVDDVNKLFNKDEIEIINQLFEKEYITTIWNIDIPHQDFEEIVITQKGELQLFKIKNGRNIDEFISQLNEAGYDSKLINDFLMRQDLDLYPEEILNIPNFLDYCHTYDKCPDLTNQLNYKKLNFDEKSEFKEETIKLLKIMLSIWDDNHSVGICHPNSLINGFSEHRELDNLEDINIEKMLDKNDFEAICSASCLEAIKGIYNSNFIPNKKEDETRYLVVVEKFLFNEKYNYLVRGIIKRDKEECSLAFNPIYEETLPQLQRSLLNNSY